MIELSIIISTYKNTQYLDECFDSIIQSSKNNNIEVLLGVDGCLETYNYLRNSTLPNFFKVFFFEKNIGPYTVFNTLVSNSNSEKIVFFGSDDIMMENFVPKIIKKIDKNNFVKISSINFEDGKTPNFNSEPLFSDGVIGIDKSNFLKLNGFEPWVCGADTDFNLRCGSYGLKTSTINEIIFLRRIHRNGLTSRTNTGYGSPLRISYNSIINEKDNNPILEKLTTHPFVTLDQVIESKVQEVNDLFIEKEEKKSFLNKLVGK